MADSHADSHGSSPAAWTGVAILLVASALICLGIVLGMSILWIIGIGGLVVGTVAWVVLEKSAKAKARASAHR